MNNLAGDELAHVASKLDGLSLARLECVSKRLRDSVRAMDGVWHDRCVELLTSAAFNPGAVTSVSPSALRHYLGLTTARQLYVTLIHLPCVPVGIWYRTDAAAYPHGELVSVYADGRGGYTMSPLDHNGRVLRQIELMRTDLRATSYELFRDCLEGEAEQSRGAAPRPDGSPTPRSAHPGTEHAADAAGALEATARLFATAVPTVRPYLLQSSPAVPPTGHVGICSHPLQPAPEDGAPAVAAAPPATSAGQACACPKESNGASPMHVEAARDAEAWAEPLVAQQVGRGACVVSHTGSESDTAVSPELAAEAVASMHEHERTVTSRFPVEHPRRLRILWPATLLPQSPPPQQALNSASSRAGAGATHGGAAAARLRWLARKATALPERVATGEPALPVDLVGPGPQAMHVRMVVATQPAAAGFPPRWLGIRTALDWDQSQPMYRHLRDHVLSTHRFRAIDLARDFFVGLWTTIAPSSQTCDGTCAAPPRALAFTHRAKPPVLPRPCSSCPNSPEFVLPADVAPPAPPAHASQMPGGGGMVSAPPLGGAGDSGGAAARVPVRLPPHRVAEVTLQRLQVPPERMLRGAWRPRLQAALRAGPQAGVLGVFDELCGVWRGIYPGHGHEIVEVSVARAHCGTASLPRHLHGSYQHAAPHPWPLAPSTDQIHVMKVRGDRNVPAGQCTLIADLANWTWGPLDWQEFSLPICYIREARGENLHMDVWQHEEKQVLGSCQGWCQINKWPGSWIPEWVPALLLLVEDQGELMLADLVILGRFPHLVEFRPVYIADEDAPGWLPATPA